MQSAYRKDHGTETVLLWGMNHVLRTIDLRKDFVLVMLDLSATFDTLDQNLLLNRHSSYLGFSLTVLNGFRLILPVGHNRLLLLVTYDTSESEVRIWSSARVDTWTSLVHPVYSSYSKHNLCFTFYADDSQRYILLLIRLIKVWPWTSVMWTRLFEGCIDNFCFSV